MKRKTRQAPEDQAPVRGEFGLVYHDDGRIYSGTILFCEGWVCIETDKCFQWIPLVHVVLIEKPKQQDELAKEVK